jgi:hypothetical protein
MSGVSCRLSHVFAAVALVMPAAVSAGTFEPGRYVRVTPSPLFPAGGKETGVLRILAVSAAHVTFELEVTMNPSSADDGALSRNGVIEASEVAVEGQTAAYRSAYPEDKALGTCRLQFQQIGKVLVVNQSGKCWWFGEGVHASGRYRLAREGEVHVVVSGPPGPSIERTSASWLRQPAAAAHVKR